MTMHTRFRWLVFVVGLCVAPRVSEAQLAPTGAHYAGRTTDTGFSGANASGGYSTTVPLELPPARGGLPIPVQIVSGMQGYGAFGLGWDLPFSHIYVDETLARRRPWDDDKNPMPRQRVSVSVLGRNAEMMWKVDGTLVGRNDADLELRFNTAERSWTLYDGNGLTYMFTRESVLDGSGGDFPSAYGGLWLLKHIYGPGRASLRLDYTYGSVDLPPPNTERAITIDLKKVSYNRHPTANCFKNEINLEYEASGGAQPVQSLQILGKRLLARRTRVKELRTSSRATCASTETETETETETLRTYRFRYLPDQDTQRDQLLSVDVTGRNSTALQGLPVAQFEYGTATTASSAGRTLTFDGTGIEPIALPPGAKQAIAMTERRSSVPFDPPTAEAPYPAATTQNLLDMTGDGRPDLVFTENGKLMIARNIATATGVGFAPKVVLNDSVFTHAVLDAHSFRFDRFKGPKDSHYNEDLVWTQTIDVNGDGRLDVIDAAHAANLWIYYLNTPDPSAPSGIKWVRREVYVGRFIDELEDRGWTIPGRYLPLSRRVTARDFERETCWVKTSATHPDGYPIYESHPELVRKLIGHDSCDFNPPTDKQFWTGSEESYSEWQLVDLNGDGYPDFVSNDTPVSYVGDPYWPSTPYNPEIYGFEKLQFGIHKGSKLLAAYNVRGVFMSEFAGPALPDVFSALQEHIDDRGIGRCGVEKWAGQTLRDDTQVLECGFIDRNGDGIVDRFFGVQGFGDVATWLGNGLKFGVAHSTAPQVSRQMNDYADRCTPSVVFDTYESSQLSALRDVTGDGVPDSITGTAKPNGPDEWTVRPGGPGGFAWGAPIVARGLILSRGIELCIGQGSGTLAGLFDLDGDGQPEVVGVTTNGDKLWVAPLRDGTGVGRPAAGRLTTMNNGYGATTTITYRSAKTDPFTQHQIPSPEIVVDTIKTSGNAGPQGKSLGGNVVATQYAYGNISLFFDPALESFRPTSYLRRVVLAQAPGFRDQPTGQATITDSYGLDPVTPGLSAAQRLARYLKVGRPRDVTTMAGIVGNDAWQLLGVAIHSDIRRVAGTYYKTELADARVFSDSALHYQDLCTEMLFPYDFDASLAATTGVPDAYRPCGNRGFLWTSSVTSWRGQLAPPSIANVQAASSIRSVDNYGRATSVYVQNDTFRTDDDYCVDTTFALPVGTAARVLNAPSSRKVWNCAGEPSSVVFAEESWEYDKMPAGVAGDGVPTAHTIYRHATDSGTYLGTIREMDVSLDAIGNPIKIDRTREDGVTRSVTVTYDEFGLAPTQSSVSGTNVQPLTRRVVLDPITHEVLSATNENGTTTASEYDEFGRLILTSLKGPIGTPDGVMAAHIYLGFAGGDTLGRRILTKTFTDPVPENDVWTQEGHQSTTFLDELGRDRYTRVDLGDDYANETLVVGEKTYDLFGRVTFQADPYPSAQAGASPYGTSLVYNADNSVGAAIRGHGPQTSITPDPTTELFPTVYTYTFTNHQQINRVQGPDELMSGTPQWGVSREATLTATGRTVAQTTFRGTTRLEYADFGHDRFGQLTRVSRYSAPSTATNPVTWTYRFDSRGQLLELVEPSLAPQRRTFSDFGELKEIAWGGVPPYSMRTARNTYDAFGRLTQTHEENDSIINDETIARYEYDVATQSPQFAATNVVGRLARAHSPTGSVDFSYDALGNVDGRRYTDAASVEYFERARYHAAGSLAALTLQLPDRGYDPDRVEYAYDSAGRVRWVWFDDGRNTKELFNASTVDLWGRIRKAKYGDNITYGGTYSDVGRRLPTSIALKSSAGGREYVFGGFDAVGRETSRTEYTGGMGDTETSTYDELGRLQTTQRTGNAGAAMHWAFGYDAIGNVRSAYDVLESTTAKLSYRSPDYDRVCSVGYSAQPPVTCNVKYNDFGAVGQMPTVGGAIRSLDYYNSGAVRSVYDSNDTAAKFRYDAFGGVAELNIYRNGTHVRSDRNIGSFVTIRSQTGPFGTAKFVARKFPIPGATITRRGYRGPWVYEFGESRGTRVTIEDTGTFLQDIAYSPFGIARNYGIGTDDARFTTSQWNGGDALEDLGIVQVGARIYDPVIGRFLSRDPLMIPRGATTSNPYAFAWNDPINSSDPSGLDCVGICMGIWGSGQGQSSPPGQSSQQSSPVGIAGTIALGMLYSFVQSALDQRLSQRPGGTMDGGTLHRLASMYPGLQSPAGFNWNSLARSGVGPWEAYERSNEAYAAAYQPRPLTTADRVGLAAQAVPYAGDYVSLAISADIFWNDPSWDNFKNLGLDAIGAGLPLVPAMGTLRRTYLQDGLTAGTRLPELQISASRYPDLADNISNALRAGHPDVLTRGGNVAANRAEALQGIPRIPGLSRDEYPFASSMEGGAGSWVGHIPVAQQNSQGALLKNFYDSHRIQPGMQYRVVITQ